jgi:hypothetical protein
VGLATAARGDDEAVLYLIAEVLWRMWCLCRSAGGVDMNHFHYVQASPGEPGDRAPALAR